MNYKEEFQQSFDWYLESKLMCFGDDKEDINNFNNQSDFDKKCSWLCDGFFSIKTYDDTLDLKFGKYIYKVMKSILNRTTFDFIKDESNYINFIIVCNLLKDYKLIDWGSSIRGCWFDCFNENDLALTEESIKYLLEEFIKESI